MEMRKLTEMQEANQWAKNPERGGIPSSCCCFGASREVSFCSFPSNGANTPPQMFRMGPGFSGAPENDFHPL